MCVSVGGCMFERCKKTKNLSDCKLGFVFLASCVAESVELGDEFVDTIMDAVKLVLGVLFALFVVEVESQRPPRPAFPPFPPLAPRPPRAALVPLFARPPWPRYRRYLVFPTTCSNKTPEDARRSRRRRRMRLCGYSMREKERQMNFAVMLITFSSQKASCSRIH